MLRWSPGPVARFLRPRPQFGFNPSKLIPGSNTCIENSPMQGEEKAPSLPVQEKLPAGVVIGEPARVNDGHHGVKPRNRAQAATRIILVHEGLPGGYWSRECEERWLLGTKVGTGSRWVRGESDGIAMQGSGEKKWMGEKGREKLPKDEEGQWKRQRGASGGGGGGGHGSPALRGGALRCLRIL
jgi:hypothetical protein